MKNSQTLAAERLQAFEKLDKAEEQKRRLDSFEEDMDYLYDRGLSALRELNYLPLTAKDSQDFYDIMGLVEHSHRLLDLDIQDGQDRLDKERKKLDHQIETIQEQYRQALEAEDKEAGYGR